MTVGRSKSDISKKLKVAKDYVTDGMKVDTHSSFGDNIKELFARIKPRKIIETGTYLGTGTTTIIANALKELGIEDTVFYTIEVNPGYYAKAKNYFCQNNIRVYALNGLSVPRTMLPGPEEIARKTITDVEYDDIFVDHEAGNRVRLYYNETNFADAADDLLGRTLKAFQYKPDFVLLDSAGHMGNIEFNYVVERLRGPCYIALDDIYHIKHHASFRQLQNDSRFEVITASKEKFGFCIAKFTPKQTAKGPSNGLSVMPVAAPVGKKQKSAPDKRNLAGLSVAGFEEFLKNKVGTAENHRDVADVLELLTPDQYLLEDIRGFRNTGSDDANVWTTISFLNAVSKHFKIENYLEIGVRRGRSLCQILAHSMDVDVYAFDLWIKNYAGAENPGPEFVQSEMAKVGYKKKINFYSGDSGKLLPKFFRDLDAPNYFDVIYVDGDHSYEGALNDLHNVIGHLKPGGILLFDDVNHPQHKYLAKVWDAIKAENPNLAYYESNYGYGLCIGLNKGDLCSDAKPYINAKHRENVAGTGASVSGTRENQSNEIVPGMPAEILSSMQNCKVLIVRPDAIGDYVIFSGVLGYFRKLYPNAHISLVVQKTIAELAQSCPHVDEVIAIDRKSAETDHNYLNTLIERLRAGKFDVAINPVYSRTVLDDSLTLKSGALEKIAFIGDDSNMDMGQKLLNDTNYDRLVPATEGLLLETKRNDEFIKGLGATMESPCKPTIWLNQQDKDYIDGLLNELGPAIKEPVVICPFAQAAYRQWPTHKWAQLLSHYKDLPVLICGSDKDRNEADLLIDLAGHSNIRNICGKTNLRQLAALFSKSRLCVASESGTAHIAAAMDCPQVVIIGGGHFGRFMPYSQKTSLVYLPMDCYNCNWKCPYWRWEIYCISQVSVPTVERAVREALTNPNPSDGQPRFFKDDIKIDSGSIVKAPMLHIANDTNGPVTRCWCGGNLTDSVHPLYGQCVDCATLVLKSKPTKEQVQKLYSLDGYWHEQMSDNEYPPIEQRAISDFADRIPAWYEVLIKHKARPEKLLEIGCAHGGFLHYCNQRGVNNVVGVEVDKGVCEFARNYFNLSNVVCGQFPDVRLPYDKFDAIVGFDVLEHLADPIEALKKIKDLLPDDGVCLFQIPCYRGEDLEWVQFRPGEHVYLYNNESVRRLFDAGGLEVDEVSPGYFRDDIFVVARPKKTAGVEAAVAFQNCEKSKYLVTAIVSTYNSQDTIEHCLQDLEEQTIADKLEIIVVNSGSQQNEESIVKAFQQKYKNIKYVRTPERETIYKAWNRAVRMASGRYITNANTDDTHRRDAIEILAKALDDNPNAVMAYADQHCVNKVDGQPMKEFISGEFSRYRMLAEWCYISSQPMWRKEVHKEFGYFDDTFVAAGDWEFWLRISQKYDFVYINEILGNRRWTKDCLSRREFEQKDGLAISEAEIIRKCYHYALERALVIDYRGLSANPVFASWTEVNLWKQKVQAKRSGGVFNPESNIKDIYDYRKESTPRLSIVIASYNNLPGLQTTLDSLNEQTENCFEVIVVNSGQIIQKPERIARQLKYDFCCVELRQNLGQSLAKNIGIKQTKGKYVAFLDDDSRAEKDFVKHILGHFSNPEIYGLRGKVLPKDGAKFRHMPPEYDLGEEIIFTACEVGTNCAFRKDILDRVGGFNDNLLAYEFQEISYKIFKTGDERIDGILYFPDVVVYHNPPAENLSYYTNQLQRRISKKLAEYKWPGVESYIELARSQYPHRQGQLEKDYTQLLNIASLLQRHHPEQALKWAEKAAVLNPDGVASGYALGSLYLQLEKYNEARVILEKILGPLETALVNGYSQMPNVENSILAQIAYHYVSTCTGLAQCYIKQGRYDKVKQVYTAILNKPYLSLPPAKKAGILNVLKKLDKTSPALVVAEKENNIVAPAARIKNDYLVSAIVSTYNSEKFLRGCLNDLENQTIADKLEIIVVNSGSEDDEESIVREFQKRHSNIVYIRTDKREGLYSAWNRAVKAASGLFLTSANTDDRHRRDALEVMAKALIANPDIGLVYGDQIVTDTPNPAFENHHVVEMAKRAEFSKQRLLFGCCVGSHPMWRKSLHDEFGGFDETLTCAADWDFWLKVAGKYNFRHIPEFLGLYYHNEEGIEHGQKIHSLYERYVVGRRYGNPYISVVPLYQAPGNPLVSVVIAAYNAENYIARAIESVLIQNYRNFELIVVDDGSTDKTAHIVRGFKNEPIKYFFKKNGGVASARNFGVQKIGGSFVIMLDSDDMMTPDYIARHLQVLQQNPDADMIYCNELLINEQDKPVRVIKRPEYLDQNTFISDLFHCGFPVVHFKTCIRRDVFDKIGPYDERLIVAEDYDMIRRFVKHDLRMIHLPAALYLRRLTESGLSRSFNADKAKSHFEVVRRFTETFTSEQLFPDVRWDKLPAEQRSVLAKCKTAFVYLGIGQQYVASAPDYAATAFEMANAELDDCCKIEPANQQVMDLREKCRSICTGRLSSSRQGVCQPV